MSNGPTAVAPSRRDWLDHPECRRRIQDLQAQLTARTEYTTLLESRFLSTLDALDELQASVISDLDQAERDKDTLVRRLEVYKNAAAAAENDRQELKSAVIQLIAKVEACNDYSKWHAARMQLSSDLPLSPQRDVFDISLRSSATSMETSVSGPPDYSGTIIEDLTHAFSQEQKAHAQTIREAEKRIAALQARVASRDAELANLATMWKCTPSCSIPPSHIDMFPEEEILGLETALEKRNRELLQEVDFLMNEVALETQSLSSNPASRREQAIQTESTNSSINGPGTCQTKEDLLDEVSIANTATEEYTEIVPVGAGHLLDPTGAEAEDNRTQTKPIAGPSMQAQSHALKQEKKHDFMHTLLLEEECIKLMHSDTALRDELNRMRKRMNELEQENESLKLYMRSELKTSEETQPMQQPSDSPMTVYELDSMESPDIRQADDINQAFPPLQPVDATSSHTVESRDNDKTSPDHGKLQNGAGEYMR